jgi:hypothetical protein
MKNTGHSIVHTGAELGDHERIKLSYRRLAHISLRSASTSLCAPLSKWGSFSNASRARRPRGGFQSGKAVCSAARSSSSTTAGAIVYSITLSRPRSRTCRSSSKPAEFTTYDQGADYEAALSAFAHTRVKSISEPHRDSHCLVFPRQASFGGSHSSLCGSHRLVRPFQEFRHQSVSAERHDALLRATAPQQTALSPRGRT